MTGEGLTAAEVEAIVCDCPVALAVDACPVHADDLTLWSEQPAEHIIAAVEAIVTARTAQAEARGREAALREAARELPGFDGIRTHGDAADWLRARADLAAEVGGDGGGS